MTQPANSLNQPTDNSQIPLPQNNVISPTADQNITEPTLNTHPDLDPHKSNAVQIVWQWLSYTLWIWSLIALSILLSATLHYFIADRNGDYEFIIYTLATMICLIPLAFLADKIYSKQEPDQKHGFAAVVMVISAVLVFLATLGSFITSVVTLFSIFTDPGDPNTKYVVILSSLVVAILGIMLFIRIINPAKFRRFTKFFPFIVAIIASVAVFVAILGPFRSEVTARDDKLIEENLSTLNSAIQTYGEVNKSLPNSLADIDLNDSSNKKASYLLERNLVEYRIIENPNPIVPKKLDSVDFPEQPLNSLYQPTDQVSQYELCVHYKKERGDGADSRDYESDLNYISTYSHKAGRVCYKQEVYFDTNYWPE